MSNHRILIVEDEGIVAEDLKQKLTLQGHTVVGTVASGEEAITIAEQTHPDLLLMDIRLAGRLDGIETAGRIQDRWQVPVIYLTAHSDEATLQRAETTASSGISSSRSSFGS